MRKMHVPAQLYALVMDLELRHLRCLVAIVDAGTFTDAAIDLGISQAAVSRNLQALEQVLGVRLLHRTSRNVTPTTAGVHALAQARQVLAAADNLVAEATTGHTRLRIGHPWSAMGRHTREFQRRWAGRYPDVELQLIRTNSATGGLAEGLCDIAVLRTLAGGRRFASAVVGEERRYCALAADDPWASRRSIRLDEIPQRTLLIDRRTGTTTAGLVARRRAAAYPGNPRHRRLAGDHRGRGWRRDHARGHHRPVPPRWRDLPSAPGCPAGHRDGELAPARPASLDARGHCAAGRVVPPSAVTCRSGAPGAAARVPDPDGSGPARHEDHLFWQAGAYPQQARSFMGAGDGTQGSRHRRR